MKIIITESQYKKLFKEEKEQKVLRIPSLKIFDENIVVAWNNLQKFLEKKGNPPYSIGDDLFLEGTSIESLGNLISVGGFMDLSHTDIQSLGNLKSVGRDLNLYGTPIKSLGNLQSVGGNLNLIHTPIESLGNLTSVGGELDLLGTPLSTMYSEKQIRQMVDVGGNIYM